MHVKLEASSRGTKVLVDNKHVKTIAKRYMPAYLGLISKISYDKKRLNFKERNLLEIQTQYVKWLEKLAHTEKHLYHLIKNASPTAARKVITPSGERMEIILDNNLRINTTNTRFFSLFPHTSDHYQNY